MATVEELRPVVALFADVVGSTGLGETLPPEEVHAVIKECVNLFTEAVEGYGGTVTAEMGDGVAAFFGLTAAREDDPVRAAFAALRILEQVSEYACDVEEMWGLATLSVKVGINVGKVAVGAASGATSDGVIALGDAVNVAARLQSVADPGSVLVSAEVAERLGPAFRLSALGPRSLRGRRDPVEVFQLLGYLGEVAPVALGRFVGRRDALYALEDAARDTRVGRGRIIILTGDAGIGKTRLLAEYAGQNVYDRWLVGRCSVRPTRSSYEPLVQILRQWLGVSISSPALIIRAKLQMKLKALVPEHDHRTVHALLNLLGVGGGDVGAEFSALPAESRTERIHEAFVRWLRALGSEERLALVLEDLDRADPLTAELASQLLDVVEDTGVLLIFTARPSTDPGGWSARVRALTLFHHRTKEVALEPLSPTESGELARHRGGSYGLSDDLIEQIAARSEGNPLYIEEFCRYVGERGWSSASGLPPLVETMLVGSVDVLGSSCKRVLQSAAVIGRTFSRKVLQAAMEPADITEALARLLRTDMIREHSRYPRVEYEFKHGLLRQAVIDAMPSELRRRRHLETALAYERVVSDDVGDRAGVLSYHYIAAGDFGRGLSCLKDAARRAQDVGAFSESLDLLVAARGAAAALEDEKADEEIATWLIDVSWRAGDFQRCADEALRLADLSSGEPHRSRFLCRAAEALLQLGSYTEAKVALAEVGDPEMGARVRLLELQIALRERDYVSFEDLAGRTDVEWDGSALAEEYLWLRTVRHLELGEYEQVKEFGRRIAQASAGNGSSVSSSMLRLGIIEIVRGSLPRAAEVLERSYRAAIEASDVVMMAKALSNLLYTHYLQGRLQEGLALATHGDVPQRPTALRLMTLGNLVPLLAEAGDTARARRVLAEIRGIAECLPHGAVEVLGCLTSEARIELTEGRLDAAEEALRSALAHATSTAARLEVTARVHRLLSELAVKQGDLVGAEESASMAVEAARHAERPSLPPALRQFGHVREQRRPGSGMRELLNGLALAREMSMRLEEGRILAVLGRSGNEGWQSQLEMAAGIFRECGAKIDLRAVEQVGARGLQLN